MPIPINDDDSNPPEPIRPANGGDESQLQPLPPGNGDGDPPLDRVRITSISPIAGALAGGITVTLSGTGFQPEAEVFFGSNQASEVTVESSTRVRALLPEAAQTGSVDVSLFNPDGSSATRAGGFTYVVTGTGEQAEVLGVSPLAVIEDTETDVTLRGRNLIEAYTNGMLALRGPSRASVTILNFTSSRDDATGLEELTFTLRVTAQPPLEPLERMAIQVLASRRPGAQNNGVFESSRQMFTVLPRARPVPLAYSANLEPGKPNLVVVAGRNLAGSTLALGENMTMHMQTSDDRILAGIVTVSDNLDSSAAPQLSVRDATGGEVAQYDLSVGLHRDFMEANAARSEKSSPLGKAAMADTAEPIAGDLALTLIPVPDQQIVGPTEQDSAVFNLNSGASSSLFFDWFNLEITILDITIVLPIVHEVHLIPFFDGGSGEDPLSDSPVLAEVGKLLRLRGVGVLVALHVEIIIHIRVVLIIGFIFDIWPFGLFNEFPEFGWAIGSVVIGIRIEIEILIILAFLLALVLPGGLLRVIFAFNLVIDLDFVLSTDGRHLHFGFDYHVKYKRIGPRLNLLRFCNDSFELAADENGQTVFPDAFGGHQSFYFPRAAGQCCVPWEFDLELVRRSPEGFEETVQQNFRVDFCFNAAQTSPLGNIIITSENPEPTGTPPRLLMTFNDQTTIVKALSVPVDINGVPTGAPAEDVRNLGYDVEFYLDQLLPQVLDPLLLLSSRAFPIMAGDNFIHVRIWAKTGEPQLFNFWPGSIAGFVISSFIARGLPPAVKGSNPLPVTVQSPTEVVVTPTLTFRDPQNPNVPTESPVLFTLPSGGTQEFVREIERFEPFETQRVYTLAVKLSFPENFSFPATLKFKVKTLQMRVLVENQTTPEDKAPLEGTKLSGTRATDKTPTHFFEIQQSQEVTINLPSRPSANTPIELKDSTRAFTIVPHVIEEAAQNKFVPPGKQVGSKQTFNAQGMSEQVNRHVLLLVELEETSGAQVANIKQLKLGVRNDETYEEYLRVFAETRALVTGAFQNFARDFFNSLPAEGPPAPELLEQKGRDLWNMAVTHVRTTTDDRPLYWARLQSICALRAYYKRNRLGQPPVEQFEWPSRGLEPDGSISFGAATERRAIVTGFDPFFLFDRPDISNPSGVIALALDRRTFGSTQGAAFVRTAVFPVRFRDFDDLLVEKAVGPNINSLALLMTVSRQSEIRYDVERFAGKNRGHATVDNENKLADGTPVPNSGGNLTVPPGANGPEFIESTLPYERVITSKPDTRMLPGPQAGPPFTDDTGFVLNQAFETLNGHQLPPTRSENHPESYKKLPDKPESSEVSVSGSGSNYLSNEIFYRTALLRSVNRPLLPSGHLHVPRLDDPRTDGAAMVNAAERALVGFLNDKLRLRSLGEVIFPDTPVNRTSAPLSLNAQNVTGDIVPVGSTDIDPPDGFTRQTPLPAQASPNAVFSLSFTFSPTAERVYKSMVRVRDTTVTALDPAGEILFSEQLTGKGVALPPTPVIAGFTPTTGEAGDDVTITGNNFAGATAVRIGSVAIIITSVDNNTIVATVLGPPRIGKISVDTPSGTATSTDSFRVIRLRRPISFQLLARREELGLQPRDIASQLGVQTRTYNRWEQGKDIPRTRYLPAITEFLGHDPNPESESLGERIRAARESEGLTRSQLAARLGVASSTVNAWESDAVSRPTERVTRLFEDYLKEA